MVAAIGSGIGNIGVSLAHRGHGDSHGQPQHGSTGSSGHNGPVGGSDGADSPTISGDGSQAAAQSEAFEMALRSVAVQLVSDAMADTDDAMAETEEDA
ncbi:nodulation protein NopC [Mesorhizobium shangrilense]|uniref:Nodulation protein NopC n=1 Tax=Mesorhizobium shangrilense TaxID=460060 RepID=A0ABV2DR70_9HYPH